MLFDGLDPNSTRSSSAAPELNTLDELVKNWRANGGDQIRSEYEAALANSKT